MFDCRFTATHKHPIAWAILEMTIPRLGCWGSSQTSDVELLVLSDHVLTIVNSKQQETLGALTEGAWKIFKPKDLFLDVLENFFAPAKQNSDEILGQSKFDMLLQLACGRRVPPLTSIIVSVLVAGTHWVWFCLHVCGFNVYGLEESQSRTLDESRKYTYADWLACCCS